MISLRLPSDLEVAAGNRGPIVRGSGSSLFAFAQELRRMALAAPGTFAELRGVTLVVQDSPPAHAKPPVISLPDHAWNILASKFAEVATAREESPFYFGDCEYLYPPPRPDFGAELVGPPLSVGEHAA
jgi:hypothetical protein